MPANRFELLTAWYLRFNGYFTIANFTVHPDYRTRPGGTEADLIAVRFPYSEEYQRRFNFERDETLVKRGQVDFLICEVKSSRCDINETWLNRERENVEYALRWMGFEPDLGRITEIATEIYTHGGWESAVREGPSVRFACVGSERNPNLHHAMPRVQQILHDQILEYLRHRFCTGCNNITRENWDEEIVEFAEQCRWKTNQELKEWAEPRP